MKTNVCYLGNCLDVLPTLPDNSVDSIVTDPPYELGFMGKSWDNSGIAYSVPMWKECLRVLKPGGHLLSFSGTRTYHRMAVAIEDAGFEVRDMITWNYGQGFPKSLNIFKQLQKKCECGNINLYETRIQQGKNREQETEYFLRLMSEINISQTISSEKKQDEILLPQLRGDVLCGTLQDNEQREKSSEGNEDGKEPIVERRIDIQKTKGQLSGGEICEVSEGISNDGEKRWIHNGTQISDGTTLKQTANENGSSPSQRPQSEQQQYKQPCAFCKQWGTQAIRGYGVGTALKPSIEPICFARKPLDKGLNISDNFLKYGTGGINIDESRVESSEDMSNIKAFGSMPENKSDDKGFSRPWMNDKQSILDKQNAAIDKMKSLGRFPANLIHDNSEEVRECFPESNATNRKNIATRKDDSTSYGGKSGQQFTRNEFGDSGNASRFFKSILYYPKASKSERNKGCDDLDTTEKFTAGNYSQSPTCKDCDKTLNGTNDHSKCSGEVYYKEMESKNTKNNHPTVKPTALMSYLIKMITPKGGIVLDPFTGSGSTLVAARDNGFQYIGIEMTEEYLPIIQARTGCEVIEHIPINLIDNVEETFEVIEREIKTELKINNNKKQLCPTCQIYMKDGKCQYCK